jgi:peptide chain release factor 1
MTDQVLAKLRTIAARYDELSRLLSDPAVQADPATYRTHSKALAEIQPTVECFREIQQVEQE